jgi:hypothetical protein
MRLRSFGTTVLTTFTITRLVDRLAQPVTMQSQPTLLARPEAASLPTELATTITPTAATPTPSAAPASPIRRTPHLVVIGFPIGIDERNRKRRALFRELWYPEYPNLAPGGAVRAEFIVGLQTYQGDGHDNATLQQLHDEHIRHGDLALVNAREPTRDPYRGDPKCTGEKLVAWFQQVVVVHRGTRFFVKADWDSWVHSTRLEVNLRALTARPGPLFFGNTLWCSYSLADYQPCGYGFGPLQAAASKRTECPQLPGGSGAIGPYPYAAGLFWGMSYELVEWIAGSRLVYDFVRNASARFEPPYWVKGEDSAFGFFAHIAPFPELTPIHWGWDVVHDGWDFRSQAERGLCTHNVSRSTLVVHSMHTVPDFLQVREELRARCDAVCERALQPFAVDGLRDLCSRNQAIPQVYGKCTAVGHPSPTLVQPPLPQSTPRPKCHSVGKNVAFIAAKRHGGTITCEGEGKRVV